MSDDTSRDGSQQPKTDAEPPGDTASTNPNREIGDGDVVSQNPSEAKRSSGQ